jgi:hypothetical protein
MNAAVPAEAVLCDARVEFVQAELGFTRHELEVFERYNQVEEALFGADRAIALQRSIRRDAHAKAHAAAMAGSRVPLCHG